MRPESIALLQRLVETPSPSGFEQPVQRIVREELANYADEVRTDVMGNVIGIQNASGRPRVMLSGHCDEIGLMVKYIDKHGFVYFSAIGGIDAHLTMGRRVYIHGKRGSVLGVIGRRSFHFVVTDTNRKKMVELSKQWIDIGVETKEAAEMQVSIGDPITFDVPFSHLGGNGLVVARGFDDKAGTFVVLEVCRLLSEQDSYSAAVFGVSSVQEEVGLRGANTGAFGINPDVGIAIDLDFATDNPGVIKKDVGNLALGKGPIISRGSRINPIVEEILIQTANDEKIPYQLRAEPIRSGTDTDAIQVTRSGVATALISIPSRYTHSPCEVVSLKDLENTAKLLAAFTRRLDENVNFIPR